MNAAALRTMLAARCDLFNRQLVSINDELASLHSQTRSAERMLLEIMGQRREAMFLLERLEEPNHGDHIHDHE